MTEEEIKKMLEEEVESMIAEEKETAHHPSVVASRESVNNWVSAFLSILEDSKNQLRAVMAFFRKLEVANTSLHTASIIFLEIEKRLVHQTQCAIDRDSYIEETKSNDAAADNNEEKNIPKGVPGNRPNPVPLEEIEHFKKYIEECNKYKLSSERYKNTITYLESGAVQFYKKRIYNELSGHDLASQLAGVNNTILHLTILDDKFKRKALNQVEEELKLELTQQEQLLENYRRSGITEEGKDIEIDTPINSTLTARQWLIAMSYFTDAYKLTTNTDKINISRLLAVLNNGKNFQEFRTKLGAKDLITANTITDVQYVATLFRELKLDNIANDIELAISKIKSRRM